MRLSASVVAACLVVAVTSVDSAANDFVPPPGCKKRWSEISELEASWKGERKVPFDRKAYPAKPCNNVMPRVGQEVRRAGFPRVAIVVFDITGSGRVVGQQLIAGQGTPWGEVSQKAAALMVYEPLIEDGVGITRVGVTVAFVVEKQSRDQPCGQLQPAAEPDFEIRVCVSR
jgi:hypothetical protein